MVEYFIKENEHIDKKVRWVNSRKVMSKSG